MNKYLGIAAVMTVLAAPGFAFAAEITAPTISMPSAPGSPENGPAVKPSTPGAPGTAAAAPTNYATMSVADLTTEANKGNAAAQYALAEHFGQRNSLDADYSVAQKWYERAGNQGNQDAQFKLGLMYEDALGVAQSIPAAYYWVSLAAASGNKAIVAKKADLEKKLTPEQVASISEKAKAFKPGKDVPTDDTAAAPAASAPGPAPTTAVPAAPEIPMTPAAP